MGQKFQNWKIDISFQRRRQIFGSICLCLTRSRAHDPGSGTILLMTTVVAKVPRHPWRDKYVVPTYLQYGIDQSLFKHFLPSCSCNGFVIVHGNRNLCPSCAGAGNALTAVAFIAIDAAAEVSSAGVDAGCNGWRRAACKAGGAFININTASAAQPHTATGSFSSVKISLLKKELFTCTGFSALPLLLGCILLAVLGL